MPISRGSFRPLSALPRRSAPTPSLAKATFPSSDWSTSLIRDFIKTEGCVPVALFGVGEMTRKVASYLKDQGITELYFVNRTEANTDPLVEQFGGKGMSLEDFLDNPQAGKNHLHGDLISGSDPD